MRPSTVRMRRVRRARHGFTLVELLISMVMIGILGVALTRLIVTQSRFSNKQVLQRNARGVSRSALNIMLSELRTVEQSTAFNYGNLLTSAGVAIPRPLPTSLTINVPWAVGIRCSATKIAILPVDSIAQDIGAPSTVGVGYYGADARYVYDPGPNVQSVSTTDFTDCTSAGIVATGANAMPGMRVATLNKALVGGVAGTPVMLFYRVKYEFLPSTSVPGRTGLFRSVATSTASFGAAEELVAPFASGSGFRFYVGSNRTASNLAPANLETISGLQLNLIGQSENRVQGQAAFEASNYSTSIFFRNRI